MKKRVLAIALFLTSCAGAVSKQEKVQLKDLPETFTQKEEKQVESLYQKEVQKRLFELARTIPTPLRVPDNIIRVFVLPYVDEKGNLVSQKYIFFRAEEGKWILGDYLLKKGEPLKELKPLEPAPEVKKFLEEK